jgi:hypothetical protein
MPLKAHCCFTHLTRVEGQQWLDPHYAVKKFVDALKNRPIQKWAWIRVDDSGGKRKFMQENAHEAVAWFGEMAGRIINDEGLKKPVLIPFPNSKCTTKDRRSRTAALADVIVPHCAGAVVGDVLRFVKEMPSANEEDGPRDPKDIYPHLRHIGVIPKGPCVLIDDVLTSGGHLAAGAAYVTKVLGAKVAFAVCGVSAEQQASPDPFKRVQRDVPIYVP